MKATTYAIAPAALQRLLDRIIFDAVLDCMDLEGLARLEGMLTTEIADVCAADVVKATAVAKMMLDRALQDASEHIRHVVGTQPDDESDCDLCAEAARRISS